MATIRLMSKVLSFRQSISSHVSYCHVSDRNLVSIEARRKQRRPGKRRKVMRRELQEGESQVLYSTHDDQDIDSQELDEEMEYIEEVTSHVPQPDTTPTQKDKDKSKHDTIDKLLPEIRKPIRHDEVVFH